MKAFIYERYGPPETLRMAEVAKPAPSADEVLVKVRAASVNAADWHVLRGKPLFSRTTLGLLRPKHQLLGVDIAGQVEAVGSGVSGFQPGDQVYANLLDHGYGGFAEYATVPVGVMAPKPANLSFEEAAAVPMAAVTALQGLGRHGRLQPGQTVLINGGSGGVGSFAVQLAKAAGAEVTAVTSTPNLELVRSLGADHLGDYTTTDVAAGGWLLGNDDPHGDAVELLARVHGAAFPGVPASLPGFWSRVSRGRRRGARGQAGRGARRPSPAGRPPRGRTPRRGGSGSSRPRQGWARTAGRAGRRRAPR